MEDNDVYLVWSHEHRLWVSGGAWGYSNTIAAAGRFSRDKALQICADGAPGTADRLGALPELPVRLADLNEVLERLPPVWRESGLWR